MQNLWVNLFAPLIFVCWQLEESAVCEVRSALGLKGHFPNQSQELAQVQDSFLFKKTNGVESVKTLYLWKWILTDPKIDQQLEFLPFPFHIFWITNGIISTSVIPGTQTPTKTHTPFNIWLLGCWLALTYSELSSPFSCPLPLNTLDTAHNPAVWRILHLGETRNSSWSVKSYGTCFFVYLGSAR